ncbi:MAG: hypothetical protein JNK49_14115 [Planctomycetes bacterium]|nr:hypothetical protein [Planctomycetota bacterium]
MSKPAHRKAAEALPTFLDDPAQHHPAATPDDGGDPTATAACAVAEAEVAAEVESEAAAAVAEDSAAAMAAEVPTAQPPTRPAAGSPRPQRRPRAALGTVTTVAGCLVMLGSMAAAVWNPLPRITDRLGASPTLTFVLGAALVGVGRLRRQFHQLQLDSAAEAKSAAQALAALHEHLERFADRSPPRETEDAQQQDLQHVLVALQRQEEKITNLTKATKMYGKPLMEIAAQTTEVAGSMHHLRTGLDTNGELQRQLQGRLENQLRGVGAVKSELEALSSGLQQLGTAFAEFRATPSATPSFEPLQQQLGRLEVAVQAVAQRLEDSEVRKSLLRLETAQEQANGTLQQLSRQEAVVQVAANLQRQIEGATARMCDGLVQLRDGNLGGLETGLREVQREVAGVATSVAQIQAAVKGGALRGGAAASTTATPPAAPTPAAPGAAAAAAPPSPAAATPAAAAPATSTGPAPEPGSGGNGYQTGARSSAGKNVLGAIAKLKQMKT